MLEAMNDKVEIAQLNKKRTERSYWSEDSQTKNASPLFP